MLKVEFFLLKFWSLWSAPNTCVCFPLTKLVWVLWNQLNISHELIFLNISRNPNSMNIENFQSDRCHYEIYFTSFPFCVQDPILSKGSSINVEVITSSTFYHCAQIIAFMRSPRKHHVCRWPYSVFVPVHPYSDYETEQMTIKLCVWNHVSKTNHGLQYFQGYVLRTSYRDSHSNSEHPKHRNVSPRFLMYISQGENAGTKTVDCTQGKVDNSPWLSARAGAYTTTPV